MTTLIPAPLPCDLVITARARLSLDDAGTIVSDVGVASPATVSSLSARARRSGGLGAVGERMVRAGFINTTTTRP